MRCLFLVAVTKCLVKLFSEKKNKLEVSLYEFFSTLYTEKIPGKNYFSYWFFEKPQPIISFGSAASTLYSFIQTLLATEAETSRMRFSGQTKLS